MGVGDGVRRHKQAGVIKNRLHEFTSRLCVGNVSNVGVLLLGGSKRINGSLQLRSAPSAQPSQGEEHKEWQPGTAATTLWDKNCEMHRVDAIERRSKREWSAELKPRGRRKTPLLTAVHLVSL